MIQPDLKKKSSCLILYHLDPWRLISARGPSLDNRYSPFSVSIYPNWHSTNRVCMISPLPQGRRSQCSLKVTECYTFRRTTENLAEMLGWVKGRDGARARTGGWLTPSSPLPHCSFLPLSHKEKIWERQMSGLKISISYSCIHSKSNVADTKMFFLPSCLVLQIQHHISGVVHFLYFLCMWVAVARVSRTRDNEILISTFSDVTKTNNTLLWEPPIIV